MWLLTGTTWPPSWQLAKLRYQEEPVCIASLQPIRTSATSTSSPITKSSGVQGVPAAPVTPVLEGGACHAAAAAAAAAALVNMPVSQRGSSPRVSSSSNYSDDLAASAASKVRGVEADSKPNGPAYPDGYSCRNLQNA